MPYLSPHFRHNTFESRFGSASIGDFDDAPTTEFTRDEHTTPFWREARDEWAQRDNDETAAATPSAKERR